MEALESNIKWKSIAEEVPKGNQSVIVSGHEWFGLAWWDDCLGFICAYTGELPAEHACHDIDPEFFNSNVMYWAYIPNYPVYGTRAEETETMEGYPLKKCDCYNPHNLRNDNDRV